MEDSRAAVGVAGNLAEQHRREEVTRWLRARMGMTPRVGLILGSGLGQLGDRIEAPVHLPYHSIPGWPVATAVGHAGNLIAGRLAGVPVVALQGRFHLYEGYSWAEVTRPIHVLSELGISALIVSNAAGGLNPQFRCGDLMLIDGHLNLMLGSAPPAASSEPGVAWSRRQSQTLSPYCGKWMRDWERLARAENMTLRRGVYVGVSGPNYETRAEYRALRRLGADAVGMSTVPEVCAAAACNLPVLGVSVITNEARPDAPTKNDAAEVIAQAQSAEARLQRLVQAWLAEWV